jgi:hypothetical protein
MADTFETGLFGQVQALDKKLAVSTEFTGRKRRTWLKEKKEERESRHEPEVQKEPTHPDEENSLKRDRDGRIDMMI